MTIEERERMLRLQLAEMHGVMPETPVEIDVTVTKDAGTLIESRHFHAQLAPHYYTSKPALGIISSVHAMEIDRVDELIALLQKAKELMRGGE